MTHETGLLVPRPRELRLVPVTGFIGNREKTSRIARSRLMWGGRVSPELFTCPSDRKARQRTNHNEYPYSYSVNALLTFEPQYPQITRASIQGRIDNVRNQSQIIFFIDEENPNDGWWVPWQPAHDFIGERHNGRGTISFVDGHLELRNREFSRSPENYDPDYGL
jgi:prepilin-type processing-associated H-X9-DG protein